VPPPWRSRPFHLSPFPSTRSSRRSTRLLRRWQAELERLVALKSRTVNAASVFRSARALVDTAPTTAAGLRALSDHLRQYFSFGSGFALCIRRGMMGGGDGAAEWLIAKRAAELGIVAV
jgi:hypothetical protein